MTETPGGNGPDASVWWNKRLKHLGPTVPVRTGLRSDRTLEFTQTQAMVFDFANNGILGWTTLSKMAAFLGLAKTTLADIIKVGRRHAIFNRLTRGSGRNAEFLLVMQPGFSLVTPFVRTYSNVVSLLRRTRSSMVRTKRDWAAFWKEFRGEQDTTAAGEAVASGHPEAQAPGRRPDHVRHTDLHILDAIRAGGLR